MMVRPEFDQAVSGTKRFMPARIRAILIFPGTDFGCGGDFTVADAIQRIAPGLMKSAPQAKIVAGKT